MTATTIMFHGAPMLDAPLFFVGAHPIPWRSIEDAMRSGPVVLAGTIERARIECVQLLGTSWRVVATIEGAPAAAGPFPWCGLATGLMQTGPEAKAQAQAMIADIAAALPAELNRGSARIMRALAERLPSVEIGPFAVEVMAAWVRRAGGMEPAAAVAVLATSAARDLATAVGGLTRRGQLNDIAVVVGAAVSASTAPPTRAGLAVINAVLARQAGPPTRMSRVDDAVAAALQTLRTAISQRLTNGTVFN